MLRTIRNQVSGVKMNTKYEALIYQKSKILVQRNSCNKYTLFPLQHYILHFRIIFDKNVNLSSFLGGRGERSGVLGKIMTISLEIFTVQYYTMTRPLYTRPFWPAPTYTRSLHSAPIYSRRPIIRVAGGALIAHVNYRLQKSLWEKFASSPIFGTALPPHPAPSLLLSLFLALK